MQPRVKLLFLPSDTYTNDKWFIFSEFEIWPESQFFDLRSGNWDLKDKNDQMFALTRFGPVTDLQWNSKISQTIIYSVRVFI
jgi:hypothetical protein